MKSQLTSIENAQANKAIDNLLDYKRTIETEYEHSQKELHDTTLELKSLKSKWNKVLQQVEKEELRVKKMIENPINAHFSIGQLTGIEYCFSLLKTGVKGDK